MTALLPDSKDVPTDVTLLPKGMLAYYLSPKATPEDKAVAKAELDRRKQEEEHRRQQAAAQRTDEATARAPKAEKPHKVMSLTPASAIVMKPVKWLQKDRIPLGELTLNGGREGIGKSTISYELGARVTRGSLEGDLKGQPRGVVVVAAEDSWEHTIVPRLTAAGADLTKVFRVDITDEDGELTSEYPLLPRDIPTLKILVERHDVALVILDPLMSRLGTLDTHKDAEVRQALEPLVAFAKTSGVAVIGIIHVNKSTSADPLTTIMGSRAFAAVARSVLFCMRDPEADDGSCLLGHVKSNLGPKDRATDRYTIIGKKVAETLEGEVWTGAVEWLGDSGRTVEDVTAAVADGGGRSSIVEEVAAWLSDYLSLHPDGKASAIVKTAAKEAGFSQSAVERAARRIGVAVSQEGFPRKTVWTSAK